MCPAGFIFPLDSEDTQDKCSGDGLGGGANRGSTWATAWTAADVGWGWVSVGSNGGVRWV